MLTCQQVTELVTDYLEGRLSFGQRMSFLLHLGMCRRCRAYLAQMRTTVRVLGKLPDEPMPQSLRDELLARFRVVRPAAAPAPPASARAGIGGARGWVLAAGVVAVAVVISLLTGGRTGPLAGMWERCLLIEIGAALMPVVALGLAAVRVRLRPSAGTLAAVAAGGALVGYAWLHLACPLAGVTAHVLVVHVGAMVLGVLLGAAASRLPAPWRAA